MSLGALESVEHTAADLESIFDRFQTGRELFPLRVAEVVIPGTCGKDQVIIWKRFIRVSITVLDEGESICEVEIGNFAEHHGDVFVVLEDGTDR